MIPVSEPKLDPRAIENVLDCMQTGWISSAGKYIEEFETRWAEFCGMKYGIAMSNGSVALSAAIAALKLQPGDEVILPTFTIISCATAILESSGKPVLVDCDPETWCMDVEQVMSKIGPRTRAIMPVHIYGHPVDMDPLLKAAREHNLVVIEDAAEAHGAEYKGKKCGGLGDISCFSFYANKIVTTGEGGMVLTNDPATAEKLRAERNLAFGKGRRFFHTELGHNYRLTNLQAAIGVAQIAQIESHLEQKRWMGRAYTEQLCHLQQLQLPVEKEWAKNVYWMYGVVLSADTGMDAVEFARRLREEGVETRPFFLGMHEQPAFNQQGLFCGERYPVAEKIARQGLYLPSGLTLTEEQIGMVCTAVKKVLR